jgi:hypothetical protein
MVANYVVSTISSQIVVLEIAVRGHLIIDSSVSPRLSLKPSRPKEASKMRDPQHEHRIA